MSKLRMMLAIVGAAMVVGMVVPQARSYMAGTVTAMRGWFSRAVPVDVERARIEALIRAQQDDFDQAAATLALMRRDRMAMAAELADADRGTASAADWLGEYEPQMRKSAGNMMVSGRRYTPEQAAAEAERQLMAHETSSARREVLSDALATMDASIAAAEVQLRDGDTRLATMRTKAATLASVIDANERCSAMARLYDEFSSAAGTSGELAEAMENLERRHIGTAAVVERRRERAGLGGTPARSPDELASRISAVLTRQIAASPR